jgi:putative transposase
MTVFSRVLGNSRQNIYKTYLRERTGKNEKRLLQMEAVREMVITNPGLPGSTIYRKLLERGYVLGRDRFYSLVNQGHLTMNAKRKQWKSRRYKLKTVPNQVENKTFSRVYDVLFADYTEIATKEGDFQLLLVEDLVSRYITAKQISPTCSSVPVIEALKESMELKQSLGLKYKTIFHTDKGTEFVNYAVKDFADKNNLILSNTGINRCYENPFMESLNKTLKHHLGLRVLFSTKAEAYNQIERVINIYNNERVHSKIGKRIPCNVLMSYTGKKTRSLGRKQASCPPSGRGARTYSKSLRVKVKKIDIDSILKAVKYKCVNRF